MNNVEALLLPPGLFVLLWLIALVSLRRYRRFSIGLCIATLLLFYLASAPIVAGVLTRPLERYAPLQDADLVKAEAQAIVILSAGRRFDAPEYAGDTVSCEGLERIRYGAHLQRKTHLPILVTGGSLSGRNPSFARLMADVLAQDYGIAPVWLEEKSRTTWENAQFSRPMMQARQVDTIYLVTHAWHMPRAVECFENVGFKVIPASTSYVGSLLQPTGIQAWLPSATALLATNRALHEWIGQVWYRVRHFG